MSNIPSQYEPKEVEARWYKAWQDGGCFRAAVDNERPAYTIMIPPPNVTGILHMGHILNNTIQDILIRRARQEGKSALWLPGTDHAGIATQSRVERLLRETEGKTRHDVGREAFFKLASDWRDKHGGLILDQLKAIGASCDWERTAHTLNPDYSKAVLTAFVRLYQRGHVYRGKRMVNWCPVSQTALSDEEVIMKPQQSVLYKMRYELVDEPGSFLEISTTRPETIMGDSGVAVHPEDERYKHLIGKTVWRPFPRAQIPIIGDSVVDREFGTGVLKVTPAHDKADFDIGKRHGLEIIDVFNADGTLNEKAGPEFSGMERFAARKAAATKLADLGLLIEEEAYTNNVGFSERADVPIEPRLSEQWFLRYPKVEEAKEVVRQNIIQFHPKRWEKVYLHWLDNIQDWCISRQLWWGHRIPVWYRKGADRNQPENLHVSVEGPPDPENWEQEVDVLDTWASSWLWPLATLGWPDKDAEQKRGLDYFYPTSVLATGFDIIFFWVARMIMAGLEFKGDPQDAPMDKATLRARVPFKDVYITGLIRDEKGRKMSKSLGNSPDPLDLVAKYGADALRFCVVSIAPQGQDIRFSEERVESGKKFCNKLWNVCRFRRMQASETHDLSSLAAILDRISPQALDGDDYAILSKLSHCLDAVDAGLKKFEFANVTGHIYSFFWNDYCDWYVEVSKSKLEHAATKDSCLAIQDLVIRQLLLILHPFTPFITEELWQLLGYSTPGTFIQDSNPGTGASLEAALQNAGLRIDRDAVKEIESVRELVSQARALKAQYNLSSKRDVPFFYSADAASTAVIKRNEEKILKIAGLGKLEAVTSPPENLPATVVSLGSLFLDLSSSIDLEGERTRLSKELEKLNKAVAVGEAKLNNPKFKDKAPAAVVAGAQAQLRETQERRDEVQRLLAAL